MAQLTKVFLTKTEFEHLILRHKIFFRNVGGKNCKAKRIDSTNGEGRKVEFL
jgi:hypothetical protein